MGLNLADAIAMTINMYHRLLTAVAILTAVTVLAVAAVTIGFCSMTVSIGWLAVPIAGLAVPIHAGTAAISMVPIAIAEGAGVL